MIMSLVASWFVGLVFLIVLLFSIQDIDAILDSKLDFPVSQLVWASYYDFFIIGAGHESLLTLDILGNSRML